MTAANTSSDWQTLPLKRIAREVVTKEDAKPVDVPYLGLENIESWTGRLIGLDQPLEPTGQVTSFLAGDVLFGKLRPYLAKSVVAPFDGVGTGELLVLRPEAGTNSWFLNYLLLTPQFVDVVNASTYGAKMPRANSDFIGSLAVRVPSIGVQVKIADFLDRETAKIDALIDEKERLLKLLDERRQALITEAVTRGLDPTVPMKPSGLPWLGDIPSHWNVARIKHVASIMYGLGQPPEPDDTGIPMIRATDVSKGRMDYTGVMRVLESALPEGKTVWLRKGDIIVVRSGAYTGDSAIYTGDLEQAVAGYDMVVRPSGVSSEYLAWSLLMPTLLDAQIEPLRMRAAQPHLNAEELGEVVFALPPPEEQPEIVRKVTQHDDSFREVKQRANYTIQVLRDRRSALIHEAVTGQLHVEGSE